MAPQQTQNICITFIQCRPNVFDVGPTLYKCHTSILCLLGYTECHVPDPSYSDFEPCFHNIKSLYCRKECLKNKHCAYILSTTKGLHSLLTCKVHMMIFKVKGVISLHRWRNQLAICLSVLSGNVTQAALRFILARIK